MAYILFVFFLVFGLYVLFSILKNQIVIKNEYYKKKKYLETSIKILKLSKKKGANYIKIKCFLKKHKI